MRVLLPFALICASPASAMLSPYYDSAEKIAAILQSADVADAVGQAPIGSISNIGTAKSGNDLWQIRVQNCDLTVELIPEMPAEGMVGKITYEVKQLGPCE